MISLRADSRTVQVAALVGAAMLGFAAGFWAREITIESQDRRQMRAAERMLQDVIERTERIGDKLPD